jgi:hypothetical protein
VKLQVKGGRDKSLIGFVSYVPVVREYIPVGACDRGSQVTSWKGTEEREEESGTTIPF